VSYAPEYYGGGGVVTFDGESLRITRSDTYAGVTFTVTQDFAGYTGLLTIRHRVTGAELMQVAVTVVNATTLTADMTASDTAFTLLVALSEFGPHPFDIQMTAGATVSTPIAGVAVIRKDQTT